ncbi:MAG: hypothetical protein JXA42_25885 [Anaerolineales bacterium]|nr:hypothetical protein [Anaerolineales bacterium]
MGDHIRTAEESTAILVFADLSTFVMAPETEIVLGAMPKQKSNLELIGGKIRTKFLRMLEGQGLEERTN